MVNQRGVVEGWILTLIAKIDACAKEADSDNHHNARERVRV